MSDLKQQPMRLLLMCISLAGALAAQSRPTPGADPGANLPIQRIGANDLVAVSVYDAAELTRTVRVSADGFVRLPMLKQRIKADGLMPSELETTIAAALKEEGLIVEPFVTVTVAEYSSHPISVMGAVKRPLTFQASGPVTLLEALARAEGLAVDAGGEILISRRGEGKSLVQKIPVKALLDRAEPEMNVRLEGGEEIRVPEAGKFFVVGNVRKPGAFALNDNAQPTVMKALAQAEGLLPYSARQAFIYRHEASGSKNEIAVELKMLMQRKSPDVALEANDILYVPDARGARAGWAAFEKVLLFGSGATSALIYAGVR